MCTNSKDVKKLSEYTAEQIGAFIDLHRLRITFAPNPKVFSSLVCPRIVEEISLADAKLLGHHLSIVDSLSIPICELCLEGNHQFCS
ncbi:unnamed protein product [Acanthoscelides obtectus]|uniref:Uncharacterized protein n=1 Tax=Acanthoscelides obtectus TaxID=200917 RepID=A0A9P0P724_ACAOB|nr:unnamed protein product [Acanthoscelides obtectus]CAK1622916.1 hypothetical protein AOBTE_LOCUS1728 [Acanthoscelides obtectus]